MPWPGGLVSWKIFPYTERLQVQIPSQGAYRRPPLMSMSLSLPPLSLLLSRSHWTDPSVRTGHQKRSHVWPGSPEMNSMMEVGHRAYSHTVSSTWFSGAATANCSYFLFFFLAVESNHEGPGESRAHMAQALRPDCTPTA